VRAAMYLTFVPEVKNMLSVAVILLMAQTSPCVAQKQCSDAVGSSCGAQRSSLMQLKALNKGKQSRLDTDLTTSGQLVAFQKFTEQLVGEFESGTLEIDQSTKDAVKMVMDFIHDDVYNSLLQGHNQDSLNAKACKNLTRACDVWHYPDSVLAHYQTLVTQSNTSRWEHIQCRQEHKIVCDEVEDTCSHYDRYRQQVKDVNDVIPYPFTPKCMPHKFDEAHRKATRETDAGKEKLDDFEDCLEDTRHWLYFSQIQSPQTSDDADTEFEGVKGEWDAAHAEAYAGSGNGTGLWYKYLACKREKETCDNKGDECKAKQLLFETRICHQDWYQRGHCDAHRICRNSEQAHCECTCSEIETRITGRKADNETGERLVCLLESMFGKLFVDENGDEQCCSDVANDTQRAAQLEACKTKTYDLSDWDITCPDGDYTGDNPDNVFSCATVNVPVDTTCTQKVTYLDHSVSPAQQKTLEKSFGQFEYKERGLTLPGECTDCDDSGHDGAHERAEHKEVDECTKCYENVDDEPDKNETMQAKSYTKIIAGDCKVYIEEDGGLTHKDFEPEWTNKYFEEAYVARAVQEVWENHLAAVIEKNVTKIMLDYDDDSRVWTFGENENCKVYTEYTGVDDIRAMFEALFATGGALVAGVEEVGPLPEGAPVVRDEKAPRGNIFLTWKSTNNGEAEFATDSFSFKVDSYGHYKIFGQTLFTLDKTAATSGCLSDDGLANLPAGSETTAAWNQYITANDDATTLAKYDDKAIVKVFKKATDDATATYTRYQGLSEIGQLFSGDSPLLVYPSDLETDLLNVAASGEDRIAFFTWEDKQNGYTTVETILFDENKKILWQNIVMNIG